MVDRKLDIENIRRDFVILPYLDKEYQIVNRLDRNYGHQRLVDELYLLIKHCILLCDKGVVLIPAFIAESDLTYDLFRTYGDLWLSRYIHFVIKEDDKKNYIEAKQGRYESVKEFGYKGYYDKGFCNMILKSQFPLLSKRSSSGFMVSQWPRIFRPGRYGNDLYINLRNLDIVKEIVFESSRKPFVWELLFQDLHKYGLLNQGIDFRNIFANLYMQSVISPSTAIISGWKFVIGNARQRNFNKDIYNISTLESILNLLGIGIRISSIGISLLENFKDTPEFTIFKDEYFRLILESNNLERLKLKISRVISLHSTNLFTDVVKKLRGVQSSDLILMEGPMSGFEYYGLEAIRRKSSSKAAILFMDIVGFSKQRTTEQFGLFVKLREYIEKGLREVNVNRAVCIPTGDGACLIFSDNVKLLDLCSSIQRFIQSDLSALKLRMGVHFGEVNIIEFENGTMNAIGHNINVAARVMDIGDENHILLSHIFYGAFIEKSDYVNSVHPLGEYEIKHGDKLPIYNYYQENVGNPEAPSRPHAYSKHSNLRKLPEKKRK